MEELSEESVSQRREWVRFDEEHGRDKVNNDSTEGAGGDSSSSAVVNSKSVHYYGSTTNSEPAVIVVENGPSHSPKQIDNQQQSAVIEATQVHVSVDRRNNGSMSSLPAAVSTTTAAAPSPAPRISKDAELVVEQVPKAPVRSSKSASMMMTMMPPSTTPTGPSRKPETTIHMPLNATLDAGATSSALTALQGHEVMHTVPLTDASSSNGATHGFGNIRNNASRQVFANGDILVTILPQNERCPWLTRAKFRPELVPEELMSQYLTLTVEEYLTAMEVLVNDCRFNCYNICYKRILMTWILLSFFVLIVLLFSGMRGVTLFAAGVLWLLINATGIFVCMWIKIRLRYHLEGCVAQVNKYFIKHKILLGVDDRGKLSCHKVNLIFVYFDCGDCVKKLHDVIEHQDKAIATNQEAEARHKHNEFQARMDIGDGDIIITGNTNTRVSRQQERGERLLLRYSQRWVKEYVCKRLDLSVDTYDREEGEPPVQPRHCVSSRCPCQFIEEHLRFKPRGKFCGCQLFDF